MNLKTIACPSCGGMVEVDEYSKSFTCNFCGYTTIIEKERNSYADGCIEKAELFIRNQQDYSSAKSQFEYASSSDPADPRPWLGLLRCDTRDFQKNYMYQFLIMNHYGLMDLNKEFKNIMINMLI